MIENKRQYDITKAKIEEIENVISKKKDDILKFKASLNSLIQMKNQMKREIVEYRKANR